MMMMIRRKKKNQTHLWTCLITKRIRWDREISLNMLSIVVVALSCSLPLWPLNNHVMVITLKVGSPWITEENPSQSIKKKQKYHQEKHKHHRRATPLDNTWRGQSRHLIRKRTRPCGGKVPCRIRTCKWINRKRFRVAARLWRRSEKFYGIRLAYRFRWHSF